MKNGTTVIPEEFVNDVKPKKSKSKTKVEDDEYTAELRSEALDLAERKKINYTVAKIKRASKVELERIMVKYEREQAEEVINYFSETLVGKLSELLDFTNVCDGENLNKDLEKDSLFQRDLKSIISYSIPCIPMVGLVVVG